MPIESAESNHLSLQTDKIKALSAVIPHVEPRLRKSLSILVKLMEIQEICNYYDSEEFAIASLEASPNWHKAALSAMLPYLGEQKQGMLQMMLQMMDMQEMMSNIEKFKELMQSGQDGDN
jgi:hypothetical protein